MDLPFKAIGMSGDDYRSRNDFFSRSYLHATASHGGEAQQWMDLGHSLVPYTNSIRIGSMFDRIVEGVCMGKKMSDMIVSPPSSVLAKNGHRRGKAYDEWCESQTGMVCNDETQFQLESMLENLMKHPQARRLVDDTNENQVSVFFQIGRHRVKVRPDGCTPYCWWDLKTTSSKWNQLWRSMTDYGYAEQEWLYVEGAKAMGLPHHRMPFVFCQTMAPYSTRVFYLPEDIVQAAGVRMKNTMDIAALRIATGVYIPADQGIEELEVPRFVRKEEELYEDVQ